MKFNADEEYWEHLYFTEIIVIKYIYMCEFNCLQVSLQVYGIMRSFININITYQAFEPQL